VSFSPALKRREKKRKRVRQFFLSPPLPIKSRKMEEEKKDENCHSAGSSSSGNSPRNLVKGGVGKRKKDGEVFPLGGGTQNYREKQ